MLHCQTATEIYSRSRKCDPLPFATMIDDNVKSNFELIKENFPPISRYIEFCGLMYFNEWSGVFLKSVENVKIIDQGSELHFSVYSCFWGTWPSVPELWPAVCWGRKTLFPDTALTFTECFLSISEVTVSGLEPARAGHCVEGAVLSLGTGTVRQGILSRITLRHGDMCAQLRQRFCGGQDWQY